MKPSQGFHHFIRTLHGPYKVSVVGVWGVEYAKAGISYEMGENKIGGSFFVRVIPRYEAPRDPIYGFKTREEAEAWIERDRKSHMPGRRPKLAAG